MLDNALIALLIQVIVAGEATAGIPGTPVKQSFQPTNQGLNTAPTAYLNKIGDRRVGYPYWADVWDTVGLKMVHTELQQYETMFQISALSIQDPSNLTQYTASDILNLTASILQSQATVASLQAAGVGIERIMDVRNVPFLDDKRRFEYEPSLDFTVAHKQIITSAVPILQSITLQIIEV